MQSEFQKIFQEIQVDPDNESFTKQGIKPLYYASSSARINIIGQAPWRIAQEKMKFWDDPSGDRLRTWSGVSRDVFYNSGMIAILPMDFYYPGKGKSGDLPPRKRICSKLASTAIEINAWYSVNHFSGCLCDEKLPSPRI